jgi:O-antigen ligase/tetratricopeptide (TPR) repeat protein
MEKNIKNILSWIIKIGLFVVPFIPLYIAADLFFPFITGKAFVFRFIIEFVFILWLILAVFFKEYRPKKNWLLLSIGIFVFVATLATVFGVNPLRSFWSNFERMEGLAMYLHLYAYFLVLGNVFRKKDWFVLFNIFVVSGLIQGIYGLMQKMGKIVATQGGFRVDGMIGNPTYLAAYLIFIVGFCSWLFLKTKNIYAKIYYALSGSFTLLIIYFTASRGPTLGILMAVFLMAVGYLLFKKSEDEKVKSIKKKVLIAFVGFLVIVGLLFGFKGSSFVQDNPTLSRLTNLSFTEKTITSRFSIWNMSWQAVKERPVLGWGPENYIVVFSKYYQSEMWVQEPWFDRSHNIVFDWLINAGILGLLSYLAIFFFALRELYKNFKNKKITFEIGLLILGIFVAYFFQNLFVFDNVATYISFFAILAWIYSVSISEDREGIESDQKNTNEGSAIDINYFPLVISGGIIVFLFCSYFIVIKPYLANKDLINALRYKNIPEKAFGYYNDSFGRNVFLGRDETRGQFVTFAISAFQNPNLSQEKKQAMAELAVEELETAKIQNPLDPRPYFYSSLFYETVGQLEIAIQEMESAQKISPKKQDIVLRLAKLYINDEQYDKAMPILLDTFHSDESNSNIRIALAGAYILTGEQDKADKLLLDGFNTADVADDFLLKIYYSLGKYDRLVSAWLALVEKQPQNIEYRKGLAGAYLLVNQLDKAIEELEKAIEINPLAKEEIEMYIEEIEKEG